MKIKYSYDTKDIKKKAAPAVAEQVARFIDEGNPNTQPGSQPSEVPDIGKPDPQTPAPRGDNGAISGHCNPTADEFMSTSEEESGPTIQEELEEVPSLHNLIDQQLAEDIREAVKKEKSLADVAEYIYIRTVNGIVTLEGYVSTEQQKMTAGDKANAYVGFGKVNNNLVVTNKKSQSTLNNGGSKSDS